MENAWSEDDSALYLRLVDAAVPRRVEQLATLLTLLPFAKDATSRLVELGCGPGALAHAVLDAYPRCRVTALDGSEAMLAHASERLRGFGTRVSLAPFELSARDWLDRVDGADAVVSSLCLHHLDGPDKRRLFARVAECLSPSGALLVADLVAPARAEAEALFRESWDGYARAGDASALELFEKERWNVYRYPDSADKPSGLFEQLSWLAECGLHAVDCVWMVAGHAIYGGYRSPRRAGATLDYAQALELAGRGIEATR